MMRVRSQLIKVRHIQDTLRAFEARDRNVAESNYVRVNSWSIIQICVMLLVGLIQVRRAGLFLWFVNGDFFLFCFSPARQSSVTLNTVFYVSATILLSFLSKLLIMSHICYKCHYNCVSLYGDCELRLSSEHQLVVNNDRFHTVTVTFSSLIYFIS